MADRDSPTADLDPELTSLVHTARRFRRVAIVHYWLVGMRGGERVIERMLKLFPDADIYTHVYVPEAMSAAIRARPVTTSFIQRFPGAAKHYQKYLPLMPMALEQFDLRGYDLVISSESGPAKGVIAAPNALHVCYCHSPMRYLWDHYHDYRAKAGGLTRLLMPWLFHGLRSWDTVSASRVDHIISNSSFIRQRVRRAWGRDSVIVHPPVETSLFGVSSEIDSNYLWVGQMTPYKRADIAMEAFNRLKIPLLMVGHGEMSADIKRRAGPNIKIVPSLDFVSLRRAYARCRGLIFTAEEDFGIVPVEAMASGRPVLAFGRGGALDTVKPEVSGLFFADQTAESIMDGVHAMENWLPDFDPEAAKQHAERFAPEHFDRGLLRVIAG